MKIAIDGGPLTSGHSTRGVGAYTRELVSALGKNIEVVDFNKAELSKYDLIHYPYFDLFFHTLPIFKKTKTVVTIHDTIPLIYPKHYPPGIKGKINFLLQKAALKNVNAVITDSETSKKDICRFLEVHPDKVHVIYLAARKIFTKINDTKKLKLAKQKYNLPEKFVLYVGDVNYNKNIIGLVKAAKIAKIPLVIVGKQAVATDFDRSHIENKPLVNLLNEAEKDSNIIRLGFVPDSDLVLIYNLAIVYCQPSFYEGFGLPVLEAISCQTPVVAAKTQALVEIIGEAATFVDPHDPSNIANGFTDLVKNPKLPRNYSWKNTAADTLKVYKKVLENE